MHRSTLRGPHLDPSDFRQSALFDTGFASRIPVFTGHIPRDGRDTIGQLAPPENRHRLNDLLDSDNVIVLAAWGDRAVKLTLGN